MAHTRAALFSLQFAVLRSPPLIGSLIPRSCDAFIRPVGLTLHWRLGAAYSSLERF